MFAVHDQVALAGGGTLLAERLFEKGALLPVDSGKGFFCLRRVDAQQAGEASYPVRTANSGAVRPASRPTASVAGSIKAAVAADSRRVRPKRCPRTDTTWVAGARPQTARTSQRKVSGFST